ncbi:MAG: GTPase Era [Anaerolineae bacterium]|nr:GTPase Era [Anaerolineae bacterium]MDQ7035407.1 GTPase Era [Anaerolineae bacterium]
MTLDSIFNDEWSDDHRSGGIAVVGRPNVGKSTLINAIIGQKVAIATPKPQTTRRNQLGIYTEESGQILFTDTPGLHKPRNALGDYMMTVASQALEDADVIVWILDVSEAPHKSDNYIATTIQEKAKDTPVILVLNKIDLVLKKDNFSAYTSLIDHTAAYRVSAAKGDGISDLTQALIALMPQGPRYYPVDQVSDLTMRFMVAEVIREKVILNTEHEIPHAVAVEVTDYKDKETRTDIYAVIYVERNSQKGIVIGKSGSMIKKIGIEARQEIEPMVERQVFLDLRVKVLKNWRSNETFMRRVGYRMPKNDVD